MPDTNTTHLAFVKPEPGASENSWGTKLNANWDAADAALWGGTALPINLATGWRIAGTAVTITAAQLNVLSGVTATAAELNTLDGVTASTAEINALDGVTATGTALIQAADAAAGRSTLGVPTITVSASAPSGGADGDLWFQY